MGERTWSDKPKDGAIVTSSAGLDQSNPQESGPTKCWETPGNLEQIFPFWLAGCPWFSPANQQQDLHEILSIRPQTLDAQALRTV
jgi:hypothetical protein